MSEGGPRHQASLGEVSPLRYYVFIKFFKFHFKFPFYRMFLFLVSKSFPFYNFIFSKK